MADPTTVSPMITDAVTQANVKVVAEAPAMAMGSLFQSLAHSTGILFENSVSAAQQQNTLAQAATNQGVIQIYSMDTMAGAAATEKVGQAGTPDQMATLLTLMQAFGTGR
ncbi:RebB family R body protein [Polycladidibacter stylochi]|uniref:RebB family R body protein n=1 Tax=Polycladidibacter stylochi TaxID=1807766 RepID=UPI00083153D8|nr:RebB family R body protein [Pseudovibrio stylochi]